MTQAERDPRVDPRPGDVLTNGERATRVLEIGKRGTILCARHHGPEPCCGEVYVFEITLEDFRAGAAVPGVVVLAMGIGP